MSMTETPAPTAPKKRRYAARRKRPVAAKPAPEFAGLTANDCCTGCKADRCVVSGKPYCAHPYKGGLQGADLSNEPAIARLNAAKKMLGKAKIKVADV